MTSARRGRSGQRIFSPTGNLTGTFTAAGSFSSLRTGGESATLVH